jgi:hypothetical protein
MGRADKARLHRRRGLDGDQFIHERLVNPAAKLGQGLGQHKVGLGWGHLVLAEATGVHNSKIRPQAVTDILIRCAQFVFEEFERY